VRVLLYNSAIQNPQYGFKGFVGRFYAVAGFGEEYVQAIKVCIRAAGKLEPH